MPLQTRGQRHVAISGCSEVLAKAGRPGRPRSRARRDLFETTDKKLYVGNRNSCELLIAADGVGPYCACGAPRGPEGNGLCTLSSAESGERSGLTLSPVQGTAQVGPSCPSGGVTVCVNSEFLSASVNAAFPEAQDKLSVFPLQARPGKAALPRRPREWQHHGPERGVGETDQSSSPALAPFSRSFMGTSCVVGTFPALTVEEESSLWFAPARVAWVPTRPTPT
ncbi:hypothetical protein VULLAG_LOCUS2352 [Vulpes lagopus]